MSDNLEDQQRTDDFRELIKEKIDNLHASIQRVDTAIDNLTSGLGRRVEEHDKDIAILKNDMGNMNRAGWFLFASSMGVVIAAFWKLVLKTG